jgi:hypothetical protein
MDVRGAGVNRKLILLYWEIGQGILARKRELGWAKRLLEFTANDA